MALASYGHSRATFLEAVPILAELSGELRLEMAARSTWVNVPAGGWLFRQGDPGDSLYVVRSGRLEVLIEEPEETVLRVLARGAHVGELALLTGTPRSASVRAQRDSELLKVPRENFAELLREGPEFALALTRELGRQLQLSRGLHSYDRPRPATITLFGTGPDAPLHEIGDALYSSLERWGDVARLDRPGEDTDTSEYGTLLDNAENANDHVLLMAGSPPLEDEWVKFCLRQSDRVLLVAAETNPPAWMKEARRLVGADLLLHGPAARPASLPGWVEAVDPRVIHSIGGHLELNGELECVARRLAGRSVGVVLSGGGARGLAHIGVLAELVQAGIEIDRIGGCSMGSYVAALYAMGLDADQMRARCHDEFVLRNPLGDYTVPVVSLVRGLRARAMVTRSFGEETLIESLPREYFSVSCDLLSGELVVHRRGLLYEAVGTSMCLPGIFAPILRGERLLVDGGVLSNLPVEQMAASGEGPVIAADVTARFAPPGPREPQRRRMIRRDWALRARRAMVGVDDPLPNLKETLTRAITIGSVDALEDARRRADLLITPATGEVGMLDFKQMDRMIELGRRAAQEALETAPELTLH